MNQNTKKDISYYILAAIGVVLIILPFFFLKLTSEDVANNVKRLSLHVLSFGAAAVSASALSSAVSKAAKSSSIVSVGSYSFAAVAATAIIVTAVTMNTTPSSETTLAAQSDSSALADTLAMMEMDTSRLEFTDSITNNSEIVTSENTNSEPVSSSLTNNTAQNSVPEKKAANNTSGDCQESDVAIFLSGKKVDVSAGFSFANRTKNIRIGDQCGCTAANTKISITDASGNLKSEKLLSTPFFTLQSVSNLELTDNVSAEVSDMNCIAKDGTKSHKKMGKLLLKFFFKNDIPEPTRKRAAKELFVQEETAPTGSKSSILNKASNNVPAKDKVEEEYYKQGN